MKNRLISSVCAIAITCVALTAFAAGQADKIFDKAFLYSIRNVQRYEQLVRIVGDPGEIIGENSLRVPGTKYHWNGRKNTKFNVSVSGGYVVDANVVAPDGHILSLEENGKISDLGI